MLKRINIKDIFEYILLFLLFFIGLIKGGYYKHDELFLVYLIQLVSGIYLVVNFKKKIYNTDILFFVFSLSYCIVLFFIPTTMSGTINSIIKVYTMFLMYLVVSRSDNKDRFAKSIVIFTIIFSVIGIDELGARILDKPLELIGSGYLEYEGKISSVFQYSNLLGVLCIASILYLKNICFKYEKNSVKALLINVITMFLGTVIILTQSKMALFLYVISNIALCLFTKKYRYIVNTLFEIIYAFTISLIIGYNVYIGLILGIILYFGINYILNKLKIKNIDLYVFTFIGIAIIIFFAFNTSIFFKSGLILRFCEYFEEFDSTISRFTYYLDALKISTSSITNFLFGIGGSGFRTFYETVQQQQYISMEVHSILIQILVESGIVGLINFLALIIFVLVKSKNNIYKLILVNILIFSFFDVFFTYAYMQFILAIFIGLCCNNQKSINVNKVFLICNVVVYVLVFFINTLLVIGAFLMPIEVNNLNNSLDEQQNILNRCNLALKFDRYDLEYISNYNVACKTYLDIMDIKKEIYGEDDEQKRKEIVNIIENNLNNELKYEKSNKYVYRDYIYYVCEYLDYIVQNNYSENINLGYEIYLEKLLDILEKLKKEHSFNDYAMQVYYEGIDTIYYKYTQINLLLNNQKINDILMSIEENVGISL